MTSGNGAPDERSIGELTKELSRQTSELVRKEIELAQVELTQKGKRAGIGAGMFGGASLFGLFALGALTAAAILGFATFLDAWLGALIVGGIYALVAGILALVGKGRVEKAAPLVPEQAIDSTKEDVRWAKTSAQRARSTS